MINRIASVEEKFGRVFGSLPYAHYNAFLLLFGSGADAGEGGVCVCVGGGG